MEGTIALEGLEFFAFHGVHPAEHQIGNRFTVDMAVVAEVTEAALHDKLDGTVDYGILYALAAEVMATPVQLLEHLAAKMLTRIFDECPSVSQATVSVAKANPPVGGLAKQSKVTLSQTRPR